MGFFGRKKEQVPPHPRQEPRIDLPLTLESLKRVFQDCVDFSFREIDLAGDLNKRVTAVFVGGMVKMERASDYILRPIAQDEALRETDLHTAFRRMAGGALYNLTVDERKTTDEAVSDLIAGNLLLLFPGEKTVLSFNVGTEEKRSISPPENEPAIKGSRDSFVENLRTNTSLVRRHLRAPELRIKEQIVGRQSLTPVDILYLDGIADPDTVRQVEERIRNIDIDALLATGNLEEYIIDDLHTAFPMVAHTERPDRFCAGLAGGRVGILMEGLPLGYLAPGTVGQFFRAPQDKSNNWMLASVLTVLRYLCVFATLLLPAFYIAVVTFHQEMIPTRLALSIIAAKRDVPFTTVFEVILMLIAFEILQEAGLRLPPSIGQTVSIIGGLVVGTAAVEAKIISPAVLIVVAAAGIAGYTMPSQEFAGALRIWRFILAVLASVAGLFGMVMGAAALVIHLSRLESFGVAYLTPFAANGGEQVEGRTVIRQPLPADKLRTAGLKTGNRRRQK
ncbi:spore germination protein [Pseudoflavonifractor phocaeensis]|uniref:spore germination protein n=1 Tax=Pseudoflavonifractor phocaeensis TaxID=1870988 RepID=UPI002108A627|nr:spore germination protein [Pseudoflavonifractor phocaeensis]MCQ4866323.1 spore germination protein [Pseudoflavonifractor phocaeensis]